MDYPLLAEEELLQGQAYNAADEKDVNNARKKAARLRKEELEFVSAIMSSPQGRKWMLNMLTTCKTFTNPIIPGDTHFTYHNIGEQNIGKKLLQDVNDAAPDQYILMMKEARDVK